MKKVFTLSALAFSLLFTEKVFSQMSVSSTSSANDGLPAAKIIRFEGNIGNGKITLQWGINENETTDRFDVEKSTDGVKFTMAALVFTSEKTGNENYMFYERRKKDASVYYRLKLYGKSQDTSYSKVLKF